MYHGTCWRRSKRHATSSVGEKCSGGSCDGNIISITWVDKSNGSKVETKSTIGEASQEEESQEENKASELKESETTIGVVVSPKIVVVDAIRHADNVLIGYTSPLRFEAPVFTPKIREVQHSISLFFLFIYCFGIVGPHTTNTCSSFFC